MICESYCSHGGVCKLEPGHDGLHDTGYCTWSDAEALSEVEANEVLREKPGGDDVIAFWNAFRPGDEPQFKLID